MHTFIICAESVAVIKIFVSHCRVGAPTPDASPRIGSYHPARLSARRSRPADQFSFANDGTSSRRGIRRAKNEKSFRFHARAPLARSHLVLRAALERTGENQSVRVNRIVSGRVSRLRFGNRTRDIQRSYRSCSSGPRSVRPKLPAAAAVGAVNKEDWKARTADGLLHAVDGKARRLASTSRCLRAVRTGARVE